jgi:hypothetical protein
MCLKRCIFLITLLISQISIGQDLIKSTDKVDDFTGVRILSTNVITVAHAAARGNLKFNLGRYILKDKYDRYALNIISSRDLGCSGSNSNYVHFLFLDGTSVKYDLDLAKIDCSDLNVSIYIVNKEDFENKQIIRVRFAKSNDFVDYTWTCEDSTYHQVQLSAFFNILI